MRLICFILVLYNLQAVAIADEYIDCASIDENLIYCPIVEAKGSELREGYVLLNYTVQTNGSVTDIEIIESKPKGMWNKAVIEAIQKWKFNPNNEATRKQWRFIADIEE